MEISKGPKNYNNWIPIRTPKSLFITKSSCKKTWVVSEKKYLQMQLASLLLNEIEFVEGAGVRFVSILKVIFAKASKI